VFNELHTWAKSRTAAAAKRTALANMMKADDILSLDRLNIDVKGFALSYE